MSYLLASDPVKLVSWVDLKFLIFQSIFVVIITDVDLDLFGLLLFAHSFVVGLNLNVSSGMFSMFIVSSGHLKYSFDRWSYMLSFNDRPLSFVIYHMHCISLM